MKVSIEILEDLGACSAGKHRFLKRVNNCTAAYEITELLDRDTRYSDALWLAGKLIDKKRIVKFAVSCAKLVAHLSTAPETSAAIALVDAWLSGKAISRTELLRAAYAADAANAADYAAGAAAYAAANAYAAYAAADAANAAANAYAAYAADAAYAAAIEENILALLIELFTEEA